VPRRLFAVLITIAIAPAIIAQSEAKIIQICAGSNIPSGYVIVGQATIEQCRKFTDLPERDNALIIKKPAPKEVICEQSPYPGNYAVTGRVRSASCPNNTNENYNNALIIERYN
jgi:hypothetical protein